MSQKIPESKYYLTLLTTQAARNLTSYYNRVLEPMGLTAPQANALGVLWKKGPLSLGEFAMHNEIGKAAAVSMIHRLTELGFVSTRPDPHDARKNVISLTEKTKKMLPDVAATVQRLEAAVETAIGEERLKIAAATLRLLRDLDL